jgi:hypothetical protein
LDGTTGRQLAIDYNRRNGSDAQFVGASENPTVQHVAPDNFARRSGLSPYCVKDLFAQRASRAEHFHSAFIGHVLSNSTAAQDAQSNLEAQVTYWLSRARDAPSFSSHPPRIGSAGKLNRLDAMRLPGTAVSETAWRRSDRDLPASELLQLTRE